MEALLHRLALEQLVADLQDAIGVGLALDQTSEKFILPLQVLGLQEVNPQDSLCRHAEQRVRGSSSEIAVSDTSRPQEVRLIRCGIT